VTIRAKLYTAILLTILGPLATTAVALHGMSQLGDRFDEVRVHASKEARALRLKFDVTDVNGWQTAYGYDGGRSRPRFERSVPRSGAICARPPEPLAIRASASCWACFAGSSGPSWGST